MAGIGSLLPREHEVPASPYEAFRKLVYAHGVEAAAQAMGLARGTLYNKADANVESLAQPTLRDVLAVTELTGDALVLESLDRAFGRVSFDARLSGPVSDEALLELLCAVGSENGHMHQALQMALADGRFTRDEVRRIRAEAFDLIGAVLAFVHRVEGLADA